MEQRASPGRASPSSGSQTLSESEEIKSIMDAEVSGCDGHKSDSESVAEVEGDGGEPRGDRDEDEDGDEDEDEEKVNAVTAHRWSSRWLPLSGVRGCTRGDVTTGHVRPSEAALPLLLFPFLIRLLGWVAVVPLVVTVRPDDDDDDTWWGTNSETEIWSLLRKQMRKMRKAKLSLCNSCNTFCGCFCRLVWPGRAGAGSEGVCEISNFLWVQHDCRPQVWLTEHDMGKYWILCNIFCLFRHTLCSIISPLCSNR